MLKNRRLWFGRIHPRSRARIKSRFVQTPVDLETKLLMSGISWAGSDPELSEGSPETRHKPSQLEILRFDQAQDDIHGEYEK